MPVKLINTECLEGGVAVLFGGESSEREVSLKSGESVIKAFSSLGQDVIGLDVKTSELARAIVENNIKHCFIALHGGDGEDGTVQAILRSLGVTFTGSDTLGCAIAMDKQRSKLIWQAAGIETADFLIVDEHSSWSDVEATLGAKMMIKPANEGSSIGMSVVISEQSFNDAMAVALQFDSQIIAEKWIEGNEYTVAIVGGATLPIVRLKTDNSFYDYKAKYQSNDTQYIIPCGLNATEEKNIQAVALKAFELLGCKGWGRIDVMTDNDGFYLLEANTSPGMTDHSLVPMAAAAEDYDFPALVAKIFNLSL